MGITFKRDKDYICSECAMEQITSLEQSIAELQWDIQTSLSARFITANRVWGAPPIKEQ